MTRQSPIHITITLSLAGHQQSPFGFSLVCPSSPPLSAHISPEPHQLESLPSRKIHLAPRRHVVSVNEEIR